MDLASESGEGDSALGASLQLRAAPRQLRSHWHRQASSSLWRGVRSLHPPFSSWNWGSSVALHPSLSAFSLPDRALAPPPLPYRTCRPKSRPLLAQRLRLEHTDIGVRSAAQREKALKAVVFTMRDVADGARGVLDTRHAVHTLDLARRSSRLARAVLVTL